MSPSLALAYYLWTRHRFALTFLAANWLALILLCRAVPKVNWGFLFLPVPTAFIFLLVNCSFSREAKLEVRESGFPSRLWHLPLPTYALVGWPMLWGCGAMALAWLTLAWGAMRPVLRPYGVEPPLWWPALTLAAALAWLQAIVWTPFPLPWLRAVVLIPIISPLAFLLPLADALGFSPVVGYGLLIALLPAAYGVAVVGVARARRGEGPRWTWPGWPARLRWTSSTPLRPSFASSLRAQVWFEWRRVGLSFPVMLFACSLIWLPLIPTTAKFLDDAAGAGLALGPPFLLREIGSLWLTVSGVLIFAPFLASMCGWEMGKLPGRERTLVLSSFLTTRPVSAWTLVRAKFEAAALSTLAGWTVAAAGLLLWFALGGHAAEMAETFGALRQRHPGASFWIGLFLLVGGAVVLTWLQIVQKLWLGLASPAWTKAIAAFGFGVFIILLCLAGWLSSSPRNWQRLLDWLPWLMGAVVALKVVAALWVFRILERRGLVPLGILGGALAVWLLSAAGLFGVLYWLLRLPVSTLVFGIVLALPLTRLAMAPLALDWNRHR
ncbi:MAG TPA: hypothetical protein VH575_25020 [Gemmataceae bacterium]|jgi:hypothetical protein